MNGKNWKPEYVELVQKGQKEKAKELVLSQITDDRIIYKYFRGLNRDLGRFTRNYTQTTKRELLTTNKG